MPEPTRESTVTLRPITEDTVRSVVDLEVAGAQRQFVATNAVSLAEALFAGRRAWYRAIYADETAVGFLMLYDDPVKPTYYLWRFMIDQRYQKMGFGRRALELLIEHVKSRPGARELLLSYVPEEGGPDPFYRRLGFQDTGEVDDGENVMRLELSYGEGEQPAPPAGKPLTHVVLFRLKERTPENVARTVERIRALEGKIPSLRGIEVGASVVESARAYDVALITRFDDLAGMAAYQTHPLHQELLVYLGEVVESAASVDFEEEVA